MMKVIVMKFFKRLAVCLCITNPIMYIVSVVSILRYIAMHDSVLSVPDIVVYSGTSAYIHGFLMISMLYLCGPGALMAFITLLSATIYDTFGRKHSRKR